jgi:polyphenol oxidase
VVTKSFAKNKIQLLHSEKLSQLPWLVHGFSTRLGGVSRVYGGKALNLGFTQQDSRAAVERNRELLLKELGVASGQKSWRLFSLRQIHSDLIFHAARGINGRIAQATVDRMPEPPLAGDGIVTDTPGLLAAVQTADCLPVKRIVEKGVGEMRKCFQSDPRDLVAAIGPGIGKCCYDVGEEVRTKFEAQFAYASTLFREVKESDPVREKYPLLFLTARAPGHSELPVKLFLDLVEANRRQLLDAGVMAKNIDTASSCTACHTELLFSFRAEKGVTGRMMAVAGIEND